MGPACILKVYNVSKLLLYSYMRTLEGKFRFRIQEPEYLVEHPAELQAVSLPVLTSCEIFVYVKFKVLCLAPYAPLQFVIL